MDGIDSAPKDGTSILAWCKHAADKYFEDDGERLTPYGARAELSFCCDGFQVVRWSKAYFDDDCYVPAWWVLDDEDGETAANPTHWIPLPEPPNA